MTTSRENDLSFFTLCLQVVFEGVRGKGWQGDIAIDEIKIDNCGGGEEGGEGGAGGGGGGAEGGERGKLLNDIRNKYHSTVQCHTTPLPEFIVSRRTPKVI